MNMLGGTPMIFFGELISYKFLLLNELLEFAVKFALYFVICLNFRWLYKAGAGTKSADWKCICGEGER